MNAAEPSPRKLTADFQPSFYPVFINLREKPCLVVGGGSIANQKIRPLLEAGARITVIAPEAVSEIRSLAELGAIRWRNREFEDGDIGDVFLVIAATDRPDVHQRIHDLCEERRILVNVVDETERCNFIVPAIARSGPVRIAISSSGLCPTLAKRLKHEIQEKILRPEIGRIAAFMGLWRETVKHHFKTFEEKRRFWLSVFRTEAPDLAGNARWEEADQVMHRLVDDQSQAPIQKPRLAATRE